MPNKSKINRILKDMGFKRVEKRDRGGGRKVKHEFWVNERLQAAGCPYAKHTECLGTKDDRRCERYIEDLSRSIAKWKAAEGYVSDSD